MTKGKIKESVAEHNGRQNEKRRKNKQKGRENDHKDGKWKIWVKERKAEQKERETKRGRKLLQT